VVNIVVRREEDSWRVEADGGDRREYRDRREALHRVVECLEAAREKGEPATVRFE
jgi:hypothetical protein